MKQVAVCCPICGQRVLNYDGKSTMILSAKCNICNVLIEFSGETWETRIKTIPPRKATSGISFY